MFQVEEQNDLLKIKAVSRLTASDYENTLIPKIENLLVKHSKIKVLMDLTQMDSIEPAAIWDDFVTGMKHRHDITKMAIIGNKTWEEWVTRLAAFVMSGEIRYFSAENAEKAQAWIETDSL